MRETLNTRDASDLLMPLRDRITPATTADIKMVTEFGIDDAFPVVAEQSI